MKEQDFSYNMQTYALFRRRQTWACEHSFLIGGSLSFEA